MHRVLLLTLLLAGCRTAPDVPSAAGTFPGSWSGSWVGELRIFGAGKPSTVPMELHIAPLGNTWQWKIVYGAAEKRDVRDYRLRTVDATRGDYEIDERNSIVLPATLRGGTLLSRFEVGESAILSAYRRAGDAILFELFAGSKKDGKATGGNGVPVVQGYRVGARQEAVLRRR